MNCFSKRLYSDFVVAAKGGPECLPSFQEEVAMLCFCQAYHPFQSLGDSSWFTWYTFSISLFSLFFILFPQKFSKISMSILMGVCGGVHN